MYPRVTIRWERREGKEGDEEDFHEVLTVLTRLYCAALDPERGFARELGFVGQVQRLIRIMA